MMNEIEVRRGIFIMILLPPTLLCKALSVWFLSRMLSPRSYNLQALRVLSKVIVMWALYNHSIKACMQYIPECKINNQIKWKVLWNHCKSHLIHNGVEMKISPNLQRNFIRYAVNYLDLRKLFEKVETWSGDTDAWHTYRQQNIVLLSLSTQYKV